MSRLLSRYWLLVPFLLLALVARDWVESTPARTPVEETIDMQATEADYYLEEFSTRKYNPAGDIEYLVSGQTLSHYPDDDRSEIVEPRVQLHRASSTWEIESGLGELIRNPDSFQLHGTVVAHRTSVDGPPIRIHTSNLRVYPDGNRVETDEAIEIVADAWQLKSVGLQSSIDGGKLTLLSNVTGHYDVAEPAQ